MAVETTSAPTGSHRPAAFSEFVGQESIKKVLKTAISSAENNDHTLGHILFSGQSGYGKTTLASIIAGKLGSSFKVVTGYAFTKPSEMISVLNTLEEGDILFIDEIHRLKPYIEEMLYIAMEEYCIDMVMPEGGAVRIPLEPFTLIGATTKLHSLSEPLKNRFVYKFHLKEYTSEEHLKILGRYLDLFGIEVTTPKLMREMATYFPAVPREIANICVQLRDYLHVYSSSDKKLSQPTREQFWQWSQLKKGGLTELHQQYLEVLSEKPDQPCGLKTLAARLGLHEHLIENDLEPLLFKLDKIEKTPRGRVLKE